MLRGFSKNKRGIDTIIASLLMVVIVVISSVMVYAYATGLLGALMQAPQGVKESMSLEYPLFSPNNNNVTLYLRNTGFSPITITGYYVRDAYGSGYAKSSWTQGPTFNPTTIGIGSLLISNLCSGCANTGTAFTFQPGNAYTVTLTTSKNAQFSFSVVR
ncbi:MAG TPA: hypothetical protein VFE98_08715 [Candidatus Bathyarchaeia archaeon]|nr:hypothetical protein [Candidatus Bathyarchaeia archaeon]